MKPSFALISIMLTSGFALSTKRQTDLPSCVNGGGGKVGGPFSTGK